MTILGIFTVQWKSLKVLNLVLLKRQKCHPFSSSLPLLNERCSVPVNFKVENITCETGEQGVKVYKKFQINFS